MKLKYNDMYNYLVRELYKGLDGSVLIIKIKQSKSDKIVFKPEPLDWMNPTHEKNWSNNLHILEHGAIENFIFEVKAKLYPCSYEFKLKTSCDSDIGNHWIFWKEIKITLG